MKKIKSLNELNVGESGTLYIENKIYYVQRLIDGGKKNELGN